MGWSELDMDRWAGRAGQWQVMGTQLPLPCRRQCPADGGGLCSRGARHPHLHQSRAGYLVLSNTSNAKYYMPDCVVVEGYGLTECAAPCTLTLPGDIQPGQVTNHSAPSGHVTPSSPLIGCRWGRPSPATWSSWRTWPRWSTSPRTARARSALRGQTCSRC